ncbi:hypothetical protein HY572_07210 [Candidatus Micrarchaeota archaeon]|nr:hypothetical protein [Candidatus Micrarchaeota archaeon]
MENVVLEKIQEDVEEIKRQLTHLNAVLEEKMSEEDVADLEQALTELKSGKAKRIEDV